MKRNACSCRAVNPVCWGEEFAQSGTLNCHVLHGNTTKSESQLIGNAVASELSEWYEQPFAKDFWLHKRIGKHQAQKVLTQFDWAPVVRVGRFPISQQAPVGSIFR